MRVETEVSSVSSREPRFIAAATPSVPPIGTAQRIASPASARVTGICVLITWSTVRSRIVSDGPKFHVATWPT